MAEEEVEEVIEEDSKDLRDDDEISDAEEAFMEGYDKDSDEEEKEKKEESEEEF